MAEDNTKLIIVLEAQSRKLQNSLVQVNRNIDKFARETERRFEQMNAKNAASFDKLNAAVSKSMGGINAAIAPLLTALGTREIIGYADAWTTATNKIAAASEIAGRQGRTLESLNVIANDTRTGLTETTDLYAKLLRSTKDVAKSEEDVAKATEIVNKAFKAGSAATSEQAAGILQLSQGLGAGILQGDELRSLRENAPLIAQAIADEFKTTIAGLKELGASGELTSARVFKAILGAQSGIDAAFGATNATISDSFTKVNNALTQYIGTADQSRGAAYALQQGLGALADNFDNIADSAVKVASVIASVLIGRGIGGMIVSLRAAGVAVAKFVAIAKTAQGVGGLLSAMGGLGAAAGPIGAVVGTIAAGAVLHFSTQAAIAQQRTAELNAEMESLGLISAETAGKVDDASKSVDQLSDVERVRKIRRIREEIDAIRNGGGFDLTATFKSNDDLNGLPQIIERAQAAADKGWLFGGNGDTPAMKQIAEVGRMLQTIPGYSKEAIARLDEIAKTDVSQGVLDLNANLRATAERLGALEGPLLQTFGDTSQIDETKKAVSSLVDDFVFKANTIPNFISADQIASVKQLEFQFLAGERSVEDVKSAVLNLAGSNPSFSGITDALVPLANRLASLIALAADAKAQIASIPNDSNIRKFREADSASMDSLATLNSKNEQFTAEQTRRAGLTKQALALEDEVDRVKKAAIAAGGYLGQEQALAIARINLDANASRGGPDDGKEYEKAAVAIQKRTDALVAETEVQRGINPLVNDYGYAIERARIQQELENAATAAGLALTPDRVRAIGDLASSYATATVEAQKLAAQQQSVAAAMSDWFSLGRDAAKGFIDDLAAGKTAAEALGNVLNKLGDKLIDLGLSSLFGSGGQDFGLLGQLFGFAKGGIAANGRPQPLPRFAGGGVSKSAAIFGEAGAEAAVPLPDGRRIPVDLRTPSGMGGGGSVVAPVNITIDATGADAAAIGRLQGQLASLKAELPSRVVAAVRTAKATGNLK